MAWVDYKKAYDMVPHSWIIESLKMAQVAENIITFLQKSMVNWKTGCLSRRQPVLPHLRCLHGTFDQDPTKFQSWIYLRRCQINHLFFMDDLKVYGKNKAEIESLVSTMHLISQDMGMEFGIKKCGVVVLKRGKECKWEVIKLINGQTIKLMTQVSGHSRVGQVQGEGNERHISNRVLKAVQTCLEISAQWQE